MFFGNGRNHIMTKINGEELKNLMEEPLNQASHYVDLLEWIIGPLEGVYANVSTISREIEVEDTAVLQLKWKNGALGSMSVTMITYPKNIEGSITIIGDKGSAKVGGIAVNEFEYSFFEDDCVEDLKEYSYKTDSVYGFGHSFYYKNMLDNLIHNKVLFVMEKVVYQA